MKTLLLIDSHSIIHRTFHALPPLTTPEGRPIQAIYGLSNLLLRLFRESKPEYAIAAFDRPEPLLRKELYADYKAHRPPTPDDLASQLVEAKTLFKNFGIPVAEQAGIEADDIIATLAEKFHSVPDLSSIVLTGDTDLFQLVQDEKILVRTFQKGISETTLYDEARVRERYGLVPSQIVAYKALVGDASDNIPGVPGVGPKTATTLLQKYATIGGIFENLDKEPKLAPRLLEHKEQLVLAETLLTLHRDVQIPPISLDEAAIAEPNTDALKKYFRELGFESLVARLEGKKAEPKTRKKGTGSALRPRNAGLFSGETLAASEEKTVIAGLPEAWGPFSHAFLSSDVKLGFDLKTRLKELWSQDNDLVPPYVDLGVGFWLLDPDLKFTDPAAIYKTFLEKEWDGTPEAYAAAFTYLMHALRKEHMERVLTEIEMPLIRVLARMELWGIGIDTERLRALEETLSKELMTLTQQIQEHAGEEFNINSPQQVSRILFEKLGLTAKAARRKTGARATDIEALGRMRDLHPIVPLIMHYRELQKLLSTYARPIRERVGPDGRLHTEFLQTAAATGRLSSHAPNLQNIPQGTEWSERIRSAFVPAPGHSFLAFDYSQLELRIVASLADDAEMRDAFFRGVDIHRLTASRVLGKELDAVTPEDRRLAKTLNFGLLYGMGAVAFAKTSGLSKPQATEFMRAYFKEFASIASWREKTTKELREQGYVQTLFGRRRYLRGARSRVAYLAAEAERAGVNHPVQGMEADIVKLAMIRSRDALAEEGVWGNGAKLLLSIHDELLFEVRDDMINRVQPLIQSVMEHVSPLLTVPLKTDISIGKDWGHMRRVEAKSRT